jgi:TIR domain-containing protein
MAAQQNARIPEIFVLWHPRCPLGADLANRILKWLRPRDGLGPEVFYRCLPAPEAPLNGLPPPLPGERRSNSDAWSGTRQKVSNLQVVLPLIEENMVADQAWPHWLHELALASAAPVQRVILPVALDATAYNMPAPLRKLNYLRPTGLPLPAADPTSGRGYEDVVRSLLKQITEAMCRAMLPRSQDEAQSAQTKTSSEPLPKVNVFLSHAKQDGTVPARRLRDYIYSQTQLTAFNDENDIAFGSGFSDVIQSGLSSSDTAALIAVRSASYASRPWCRREISLFRRPRRRGVSSSGAACWSIYPSLVVEAMEGSASSASVPEFGNSTLIRWVDDDPGLEEFIVTTVIRDAMLASFHAAMGASIPSNPRQIVINWLPDPTTLLHIPELRSETECDVLYPGRGLSGLELDILAEFFPRLTFRCFEEALS